MLSVADKRWYSDEITLAIMRLNQHYGSDCPTPAILWDLRGTSTLGRGGIGRIRLNAQYAEHLGRDSYREVVLHEACHTITMWRQRIKNIDRQQNGPWAPHGDEWKRAMRLLGLRPSRTFTVPQHVQAKMQPARRVGTVGAACACQIHRITMIRYNKMLAGASYRCQGCKTTLSPYRVREDGSIERTAA